MFCPGLIALFGPKDSSLFHGSMNTKNITHRANLLSTLSSPTYQYLQLIWTIRNSTNSNPSELSHYITIENATMNSVRVWECRQVYRVIRCFVDWAHNAETAQHCCSFQESPPPLPALTTSTQPFISIYSTLIIHQTNQSGLLLANN